MAAVYARPLPIILGVSRLRHEAIRLHRTTTGIGPALRKARLHRGKSLEEASRQTRIRADYLEALEREEFHAVPGDVYVRGFLRTYSSYLGLRPEKVLGVYEGRYGPPGPTPDPAFRHGAGDDLLAPSPGHPRARAIAGWGAVGLLVAAGLLGLLSRTGTGPPPEDVPSTLPTSIQASGPPVTVAMTALEDVGVTVVQDGVEEFSGLLREGESRSFEAAAQIGVRIERGQAVELTVNDHELGAPGIASAPYEDQFGPSDFRDLADGSPRPDPPVGGGAGPEGSEEAALLVVSILIVTRTASFFRAVRAVRASRGSR